MYIGGLNSICCILMLVAALIIIDLDSGATSRHEQEIRSFISNLK